MLLAEIPWARRVWALPFLTVPAPSRHYHEARGRRHKTITDWARQMLCRLRRWLPDRELVVVGDRTYATLKLLATRQDMDPPITFLTRLRLDAVLHDPPPARPSGITRASPPSPCAGCSCATRPDAATPRPCSAPTPTGPRPPSSPPTCSAGRWRPRSRRSAPTWVSRSSASGRRPPSPAPPRSCSVSRLAHPGRPPPSPDACPPPPPGRLVCQDRPHLRRRPGGDPPRPLDAGPAFFAVPVHPRHPKTAPTAARTAAGRPLPLGLIHAPSTHRRRRLCTKSR